jgi:uncharacterized protein YceK
MIWFIVWAVMVVMVVVDGCGGVIDSREAGSRDGAAWEAGAREGVDRDRSQTIRP